MAIITTHRDEVAWYPMRIAYQQWAKVKRRLDEEAVENLLPMEWKLVQRINGTRSYRQIPKITSLIFVRESFDKIHALKTTLSDLEPLRFYTRPSIGNREVSEVFTIPDKQMTDFKRLADSDDERVTFLEETDYLNAEGQRVRITQGEFAGVEGVIKRIKNNKCVVVQIRGLAAIAYQRCPISTLVKL